ncbi:hypothetical protein HID58_062126 [Brassica napus]|uniref:Uncharacterized protein n=1 Tax=Brassica napus TaxID=3708 RepID=A0ABQ8A1P3_BRANA|nr:hypothetical protein HID58_062126 [Brassica napus]
MIKIFLTYIIHNILKILHEEEIEIKLLGLSPVPFGDSASGILGQFDEYSRLLLPVACGLFDGAVRLLTPRRALLDARRRLYSGVLPVSLIYVSRSSLSNRLSFLSLDVIASSAPRESAISSSGNIDPVCDLNNREDGSLVSCSSSVRLCLTAEFRRVSTLRRWKAVRSLLDPCFRMPGVPLRGGTRGCLPQWVSSFWAFGPKSLLCLGL